MERLMKQGIVFSLDAAIAVVIVLILLINTSYYFTTASRESVSQLHLIRIGNDVMHMLDLNGDLRKAIMKDYAPPPAGQTPRMNPFLDPKDVNASKYLPEGYAMKVLIFDMAETEVNRTNAYAVNGVLCDNIRLLPPVGSGNGCTCSEHSCNGTFNVTTPSLGKVAYYGIRLNVTSYGNMTMNISARGGENPNLVVRVIGFSTNATGMTLAGGTLPLDSGVNSLLFTTVNSSVHWFTLLGAKEYAAATPGDVPVLVNETFIGSGEKLIALNGSDNKMDFGRLIRYYIWVR